MKINSKFTRLKCKTWNHKLLKGNKGIITPWHGSWQGFLDMTPKSQAPKPKMNKRDYLKPKSFFTAKEAINKMIRQPLKWDKIFTNNILYRVDTQNIQRTQKKKKSKQLYWENSQETRWDRNISKEDIQMTNRYMKICSTLLIIAVVQSPSCVQLCNPMDYSMSAFLILHCLLVFAQIQVC